MGLAQAEDPFLDMGDLHDTKREHDKKLSLLTMLDLQLHQVRQRQKQDDNIADHVNTTKSISLRVEVVAVTLVLRIPTGPVVARWQTLESCGDHSRGATEGYENANHQCQLLEL